MKTTILLIDTITNNFFQEFQNSEILMFLMKFFSFFANIETLIIFSVISFFILLKKSKLESKVFAITMIIAGSIVYFLKEIFQRTRPEGIIDITSFSFPSGHATLGMIFYGFIAYFAYRHIKKPNKKPVIILSLMIAILTGFSRIFLGIHWLSDVIAGFFISGIILFIAIYIIEKKDNFNSN